MDEPKRELVRAWLVKARQDIDSAKRLAGGPEPIFETSLYHFCAQIIAP